MTTENIGNTDPTDEDNTFDVEEIPALPGHFLSSILYDSSEGQHVLTIAVWDENNEAVTHQLHFKKEDETITVDNDDVIETISHMVEALFDDPDARIGAALRSFKDVGTEVRCWNIGRNGVVPFSRQAAIDAYCENPFTGKISSPTPDTAYCDAWFIDFASQ